jgi:hypothetical protein
MTLSFPILTASAWCLVSLVASFFARPDGASIRIFLSETLFGYLILAFWLGFLIGILISQIVDWAKRSIAGSGSNRAVLGLFTAILIAVPGGIGCLQFTVFDQPAWLGSVVAILSTFAILWLSTVYPQRQEQRAEEHAEHLAISFED